MLNAKTGQRELAYVAAIEDIQPIANYDRVEYARVGAGWWVIVKKGQFNVGDKAIYIEIDSLCPQIPAFEFLAKRNYKVKTLKMCGVLSQGLIVSFEDVNLDASMYEVGDPLTEKLGITYYVAEDNVRKGLESREQSLKTRHPKLVKSPLVKKLMKYKFTREIIYKVFAKKTRGGWPEWVKKTDEERVQNCSYLFLPGAQVDKYWIATEKVDGTSTTFTIKRRKFKKPLFLVCSRSVCFTKGKKDCFYDTNVYIEMAEKYQIEEKLKKMLALNRNIEYITLQGETYGDRIQKRNYGLTNGEHRFAAFNLIIKEKDREAFRCQPFEMKGHLDKYDIPCVPIIGYLPVLSCEQVLSFADGESVYDGGMREGLVFRNYKGDQSFKAVSNAFLEKYH